MVCSGLSWSEEQEVDGRFPGIRGGEGRWSVRPCDLHQAAADRREDPVLGESCDVIIMS